MSSITAAAHMLARAAGLFWTLGLASCGPDAEPVASRARSFPASDLSAAPAIDPCRVAMAAETDTIEDFEHGIASRWWIGYDGTAEKLLEPSSADCGRLSEIAGDVCFAERRPEAVCDGSLDRPEDYCYVRHWPGREPVATEVPGGRCGVSRYALRVVAENLTDFGGALGVSFYQDPHDASKWDGISLWARGGRDFGRELFVNVSDKETDEVNGREMFEDGKPRCLEATDDKALKCDRFGAEIELGTRWRFYEIPFLGMKQRGFGRKVEKPDTAGILGVSIGFGTGSWDFWIDDVALYRAR